MGTEERREKAVPEMISLSRPGLYVTRRSKQSCPKDQNILSHQSRGNNSKLVVLYHMNLLADANQQCTNQGHCKTRGLTRICECIGLKGPMLKLPEQWRTCTP